MSVISVADFFTTEVWTMHGLVRFHTLFVMNLATRKVHIAQNSCQMDGQVMAQVARNLTDIEDGFLKGQEYFICDHDSLLTGEFRKSLKDSGIDVIQTRVGCPEQNGYAERFVKSIKTECLDKLIFCGEKSLRKAIKQYVKHYHHERNQQGLDNLIPFPYTAHKKDHGKIIAKSERLGGLLKYYHREPNGQNGKEGAKAA